MSFNAETILHSTCAYSETVGIIVGGILAAILIISIAVTVSVIVIVKSRCRNVSLNKTEE